MVIIILSGVLGLTIIFLATAILHIHKLQDELISIDKEQHNQNKNIMDLMKTNIQHQEMLLQHIEILKYLVEQDPALGKTRLPYFGTIGKA